MEINLEEEELGTIYFVDYYDGVLNGLLVTQVGNCYLFESAFAPPSPGHFERKMAFAKITYETAYYFLEGARVKGSPRFKSLKYIWVEVSDEKVRKVYGENEPQFISYMLRDAEKLNLCPIDEPLTVTNLARDWGQMSVYGEEQL
jgi:hypothetical protein